MELASGSDTDLTTMVIKKMLKPIDTRFQEGPEVGARSQSQALSMYKNKGQLNGHPQLTKPIQPPSPKIPENSPFFVRCKGFEVNTQRCLVQLFNRDMTEAIEAMQEAQQGIKSGKIAPCHSAKEGTHVIGRVGTEFIRGQITEIKGDFVSIFDYDELEYHEVQMCDIFPMTSKVLLVPYRTAKVELEHLGSFGGTEYLSKAIAMSDHSRELNFQATCIPAKANSPVLRMETLKGENISLEILKNVKKVMTVRLKEGDKMKALITHYTPNGVIYFQNKSAKESLLVQEWLEELNDFVRYEILAINMSDPEYSNIKDVQESLKNEGVMFLSLFEGAYYRAKVIGTVGHKYRVRYIDFGNEDVVIPSNIILLDKFDKAIQYFPEQAICAQLEKSVIPKKMDHYLEMVSILELDVLGVDEVYDKPPLVSLSIPYENSTGQPLPFLPLVS